MPDEPQEELGRFIAARRSELGLSLGELSETAELSKSSLSDIENGRWLAKRGTLDRLARALKVDPGDLYALAGRGRPTELPSIGPYLRSKYGNQLSSEELKDLEDYFQNVIDDKPSKGKS